MKSGLALRLAQLALMLCASAASAAPPESPAELARQHSEARRIEAEFVERVAAATGMPAARIAALLPGEPRIADRGRWLVQAIGKALRPLSDDEQAAVIAANQERLAKLAALRTP